MNYVIILTGGKGTRVKTLNIPKQFYEINNKPIVIYTIEKFMMNDNVNEIYLAVDAINEDFLRDLVDKFFPNNTKIQFVVDPKPTDLPITKIDVVSNVIDKLIAKNGLSDNDILMIHDAVRPFVSQDIINNSIIGAGKYGATVAALPAVDTILKSEDALEITDIPDRSKLFYGQTPDSFQLKKFINLCSKLDFEQKKKLTGTSQVCTFNGEKIYTVLGDAMNFKITTDFDLLMARAVIKENYDENYNRNSRN